MRITCRVLIYFGNVGCCVDFEEWDGETRWNKDGSENKDDIGQSEEEPLYESYFRNAPY